MPAQLTPSNNRWLEENNLDILDRLRLHDLYVERYEKGVSKEYKKILKELYKKVIDELISIEDLDTIRGRRLIRFIQQLDPFFEEFKVKINEKHAQTLSEFIDFETATETKLASAGLGGEVDLIGFTTEKLTAATALHMGTGQKLDELFDSVKASIIAAAKRECSIGFLQGETTQQIISRLRKQEEISGRAAEALVRTTMTHVSAQARNLVAKENLDVIDYVRWDSVLDFRTSEKCRYRDGKLWKADEDFPMPPAHVNCRSSIVYVTDTKLKGLERVSKDGPVSASTTYYDFLKRQKKSVIEDILGVERAELFRSGKLTGDQLHARDGKLLTIDELYKKYDL